MLKRFLAAMRDRWRNRRRTTIDQRALDRARSQGQQDLDTTVNSQWNDPGF
jgi:hypothetical protein